MTPATVPCPWCGAEVPDTTPDCPQCQREVVVTFAPRVESADGHPPTAVAPMPDPDPPELPPLGSPPSRGLWSGVAVDQPTLHTTEPPHGPSVPANGSGRWLWVYAVMVTVFAVWGWVKAMR